MPKGVFPRTAEMGYRRHGHADAKCGCSPTYKSFRSMKDRCTNPNAQNYPRYGGRGIMVCGRWSGLRGFLPFLEDMGERPEGTTLDRVDTSGNYEPSNCRWATAKQQARNRRSGCIVEYQGERKTMAEWAEQFSIPYKILWQRLDRGMMFAKAVGLTSR